MWLNINILKSMINLYIHNYSIILYRKLKFVILFLVVFSRKHGENVKYTKYASFKENTSIGKEPDEILAN